MFTISKITDFKQRSKGSKDYFMTLHYSNGQVITVILTAEARKSLSKHLSPKPGPSSKDTPNASP